jgi:hypothetical protein
MKFRRPKQSTTYKSHFVSALCRSLFTNASLIFVNSIFVKTVGGKSYSQLFFFASLASLIYYAYFAARGHKEAFGVYKAVIGLTFLASGLCFAESFMPALQPFDHQLLYFFAVAVIVVDLVGTTVGPVILQLTVNPALFRDVYQKIVTSELLARITAAGLVWILSTTHQLIWCFPIGWITLAIHLSLFSVTVQRMRVAEHKLGVKSQTKSSAKIIARSLKFILSNPLVRVAMSIMVWTHVTKFVVEYLFYQVADSSLGSARQVAEFVSATTISMILFSLIAQHLIGKKLTDRLQLSTLFSFQPINILVLGSIALMVSPFWPLVLLMVTYNVINRSIQLPVTRQCLVPVPRRQRATIVSLIFVFMSTSSLVMSGAMATMKNVMHLQDFLVILLLIGASVFLLITGLDSYYIRNLWSFYRESRSGHWQDEPVAENLSSMDLESGDSLEEEEPPKPTADLKSDEILETYARTFDQQQLSAVTNQHRQLLRSTDASEVLRGLRICFVTGFPWFEKLYKRSLSHENVEIREFSRLAQQVNEEFTSLENYSAVFRRRIKSLALEFLEELPEEGYDSKLKELLNVPNHDEAESLVAALSDAQFSELKDTLLSCVVDDGRRLTLDPIVERMYDNDYDSGYNCRALMDQLSFGRNNAEIRDTVAANLANLSREKLAFFAEPPHEDRDPEQFQRFMHTLFIEEYRLCPHELDRALTDTIGEFQSLSPEDSAMLVDMHLEFLKRSELFHSWQTLLA